MADEYGHGRDRDSTGDDDTFLITTAAPDREAQFRARKRRYFLMMSIRIPALIIASIVYGVTQNGWIALAIIVVSIPIPWIAVIKANDAEPRKHGEVRTYHYGDARNVQPTLTTEPDAGASPRYDDDAAHPVIDAPADDSPAAESPTDEAPADGRSAEERSADSPDPDQGRP